MRNADNIISIASRLTNDQQLSDIQRIKECEDALKKISDSDVKKILIQAVSESYRILAIKGV